jgi:hypothetical protein
MLEDLLSKIEVEQSAGGNIGNIAGDFGVTAGSRATPSGNIGSTGNTLKNGNGHACRASGESGDDDLLSHPERYEVVQFTGWRLPSGRRVAFKLAIPKEKYDGFELLRLLEIQGQQRMTTRNDEDKTWRASVRKRRKPIRMN